MIFSEELQKCALVVYNMEVLNHFVEECVGSMKLGGVSGHFGILGHFG